MRFCFLLLFVTCYATSQTSLKATVFDGSKKEPIPYAVAGIPGKKLSAVCDAQGNFELRDVSDSDTIKVMSVGYRDRYVAVAEIRKYEKGKIFMYPHVVQLDQVNVKAGKQVREVLGNKSYSKKNCTAFMGTENNWKGEEAAIRANYDKGAVALIEDFNFYIIQNKYEDSLVFRLMLYSVNDWGMPGRTFLSKPIIFKTAVKQGVVHIDLKDKMIYTDKDFFISLECLKDEMHAAKFCFAGSIDTPSYARTSAFSKWRRLSRGGADFNVTVSYQK